LRRRAGGTSAATVAPETEENAMKSNNGNEILAWPPPWYVVDSLPRRSAAGPIPTDVGALLAVEWLRWPLASIAGWNRASENALWCLAEMLELDSVASAAAYACAQLGGVPRSEAEVVHGVEDGGFPAGTRIWAGGELVVMGVLLVSAVHFELYDPSDGGVAAYARTHFGRLAPLFDAYVVVQP